MINALGHTLRWRVEGLHHLDAILASGRQPVMAFWHGRILPATFYFRRRGIVVITSENFDGEWIARVIERFGYGTARGSTTRGARKAMVELVRECRGKPAGFTVDGPRGPAASRSRARWLARATGNPLLPFRLEASSSLERAAVGSRADAEAVSAIALVVGEPIEVAKGTKTTRRSKWSRPTSSTDLSSLKQRARALLVSRRRQGAGAWRGAPAHKRRHDGHIRPK